MPDRSDHAFGGLWTAEKLEALRKYLDFYTTALQSKPFKLVYIDTFAGTGKCTIRVGVDGRTTISGSARIALDSIRPFDTYIFIEQRAKHVRELERLRAEHPMGQRATIIEGDAAQHLDTVLARYAWSSTRGVLFLDPYGLQCSWSMVQSIAATKALDVFFLVSVSGLARQAATSTRGIDGAKAAALDRFLGTPDWRAALYKEQAQSDLFYPDATFERERGSEAITAFVQHRMHSVFPFVEAPLVLRHPTSNAALYALFFAVSNPSLKAIDLAKKVSSRILTRPR